MLSDAEREVARKKIIDARVQRRLATDRAYLNAENAEEQKQREEEIEAEVERAFDSPTYFNGERLW